MPEIPPGGVKLEAFWSSVGGVGGGLSIAGGSVGLGLVGGGDGLVGGGDGLLVGSGKKTVLLLTTCLGNVIHG
jgi:hypothetical protein